VIQKRFFPARPGVSSLKRGATVFWGRAENLFAENEDSIGWPAQNSSPTRHQK
jgi:hypothetical protein